MNLEPGWTCELSETVCEANSTDRGGGIRVFATPMMVRLVEQCCSSGLQPFLAPGRGTVGARVEIRHLAPSLLGMTVTARARLVAVDGRKLTFAFEVFDEVEKVGEGSHDRFIIDFDRYQQRLDQKRAAWNAR